MSVVKPEIHYTRFPVSCQLVGDLLATSRCNGISETTRHNRHNQRTFVRANLLQTCYGLVVYVADFFGLVTRGNFGLDGNSIAYN